MAPKTLEHPKPDGWTMTQFHFIVNFLQCTWADHEPPKVKRKIRIITLCSIVAITGAIAIGVFNLFLQSVTMAMINFGFALTLVAIIISLRFQRTYRFSVLSTTILYFAFCLLAAALEPSAYTGSILWILIFPIIVTSCLGIRLGIALSATGGIITLFILCDRYLLDILASKYDPIFSFSFMLAYSIICFLVCFLESLRLNLEHELRRKNTQLEYLSRTDGLTGLSNRRDILDKIEYEARRCERAKSIFCLVLADIDNFKQINDTYGHTSGDTVLVQVADTLKETIRSQDTTAVWEQEIPHINGYPSRYGGEEFLVLLPDTDLMGGEVAAEKLRMRIGTLEIYLPGFSRTVTVTMSFGVSACQTIEGIEACIKEADKMLYLAKENGRNRVQATQNI